MKHIDLIIAEIKHGQADDNTCTCNSGTLRSSLDDLVETLGVPATRVALSIATTKVFPREMLPGGGERIGPHCQRISRQKLAKVLEEMKKERLLIGVGQ